MKLNCHRYMIISYIYIWLIPCQRKQEKTLTSPILLKITENIHIAVNRWHTKFETDRITFRGHLRVFLSGGWKAFFSKPLLRNFTSHSIIHCTHSFVDRKIPKLPPESSYGLLFYHTKFMFNSVLQKGFTGCPKKTVIFGSVF